MKPILLPYEGSASQVYVFDIPRSELKRVMEQFCRRSMGAKLETLDGYTFPANQSRGCGPENLDEVLEAKALSVISGVFHPAPIIDLWVWPDKDDQCFDAEFVFFSDHLFGAKDTDEQQRESFGLVYSLAEMARQNYPECECAVSVAEVGDPRDHRGEDWTVFW
ncbi:MAG: hypothetical protein NXH88_12775 [Hyphomonas sp.]|nr:hypothetical protein [Hyphomonas sp.]